MAFELIDREECIGDSLTKINSNSSNFDTRITSISANFIKEITNTTNITVTVTGTPQVASIQAIGPGIPLGWISFQGLPGSGAGYATTITSYNLSPLVNKTSQGNYTVQFLTPRTDTNYIIFSTVASKAGSPGIATIKLKKVDEFDLEFRVASTTLYDPTLVDVIVFGYPS